MAKKAKSDFNQMLTLIRRIIVLTIAAIGLVREWPYETVALRSAVLWAVLYISSLAIELLFQHLSFSARKAESARASKPKEKATGLKPAVE